MTVNRQDVMAVVERAKATWDFAGVESELKELMEDIHRDSTLIEVSKRPLTNVLRAAATALEERHRSPDHLLAALDVAHDRISALTEDEAKQLASWFFRVAYSGGAVTVDIELRVRPILARVQGDAGFNKRKLSGDLEKYTRLSEWGTDLILSERNLCGLLVASRVLALPKGCADNLRGRVQEVIDSIRLRQSLTPSQLGKESLQRCRELIEPVWKGPSDTGQGFLSQEDTVALHVCLSGLSKFVAETESLADDAEEMVHDINQLWTKFQQVRYPSSTYILNRFKAEIDDLGQMVTRSIDFEGMKERVKGLQARINQSRNGTRGIDWMHFDHVAEANSMASNVFQNIRKKEHDPAEFNLELARLSMMVNDLENRTEIPTASELKRVMSQLRKDSQLNKWLNVCFHIASERHQRSEQVEQLRQRLNRLWESMESHQEQRFNSFRIHCAEIEAEVGATTDLHEMLGEILNVTRTRDEFTRDKQNEIQAHIDRLFAKFKERAVDVAAVHRVIDSVRDDINRAHRRILSPIDFDGMSSRITAAKHWILLRDFPLGQRGIMIKRVNQSFAEVRKLRFRHEAAKQERQTKAEQVASDLQHDIAQAAIEATENSGNPETWQHLVELDQRLRESSRLLTNSQFEQLRQSLDTGFNKIRTARVAFATEATRVFAEYNEVLSNVLFNLEEEPTRETALEAIGRIKPIRAALRTENRLLRAQGQELAGVLKGISDSISEVFEQADAQSADEHSRVQVQLERLSNEVKNANTWQAASALIAMHKQLSAIIRDANLSIADRKTCRVEMEHLWEEISERLQALRSTRDESEDINTLLGRLEKQGYLQMVRTVPRVG